MHIMAAANNGNSGRNVGIPRGAAGQDASRYSRANYGTTSGSTSRYPARQAQYAAMAPAVYGKGGGNGGIHMPSGNKRRHRVRNVVLAVLLVLLLLLAACGVAGYQLYQSAKLVRADASVVTSGISDLGSQITGTDTAALQQTAASIQEASDAMYAETQGTLWSIAAMLPVVGTDISNVQTLSSVLHTLSDDAIVPLTNAVVEQGGIHLSVGGGVVDCTALVSLAEVAAEADDSVQAAASQVDNLSTGRIDQVNSAVSKAKDSLDTVASLTGLAREFSPSLRMLLGMDGEAKAYLIACETNSEIRACGGFTGQECVVTADNGLVAIGDFFSAYALGYLHEGSTLDITAEEEALFTNVVSFNPYDMNMNPDGPRAMSMLVQAYERLSGQSVDGVVMFDAIVMQRLIGASGSITTSSGATLDGTNAAQMILNEAYIDYTSDEQDIFFSDVADSLMDKLSGSLDKSKLKGLWQVVEESTADHRLLAWSSDDAVQAVIEDMGASGALVADEATPQLGVYFNNVTYGKIDWYLDANTQVTSSTKNADGSTTYHVVTTMANLTSDAEVDEITEGPGGSYIKGSNSSKRSSSDMVTRVLLYAPYGGSISNVVRTSNLGDAYYTGAASLTYNGFNVEYAETHIRGGETVTIAYDVTTSPNAQEELDIRVTPTGRNVEG